MATFYALASATGTGNAGTQGDPFSAADLWSWMINTANAGDVCELKDDASGFDLGANRTTARDGSTTSGRIILKGVSDWGTPASWGSLPKITGSSYTLTVDNYWTFALIEFTCRQLKFDFGTLIRDCYFNGSQNYAQIDSGSTSNHVIGCTFRHTPTSTVNTADLQNSQQTVHKCVFSGNNTYPTAIQTGTAYSVFVSCCVFDTMYAGVATSKISDRGSHVFECTMYDCNRAVNMTVSSSMLSVFNCVMSENTYGFYNDTTDKSFADWNHFYNNGSDYRSSSDIIGKDNDSSGSDPKFVDPSNATWSSKDFSLDEGSPCLDNGWVGSGGFG